MKILFLTTYNVTLFHDHFFTRNVAEELAKECKNQNLQFNIATISPRNLTNKDLDYKTKDGEIIHTKLINVNGCNSRDEIVGKIYKYLENEKPDIIHSQMIEGYDIEAAKRLNIPIVNTIHIGGFICPRGGGDGFLRYDDSICHQPIGKDCAKCMSKNLPFPKLTYLLHKSTPHNLKLKLRENLGNKNIFYLTPFLNLVGTPDDKKKFLELAKYSHKICANDKLIELFKINGISENLHLIPHGVKPRKRLPLPSLEDSVKFYFLARVQYSKGLHIIIEAFKDIPKDKYELHIIGDTAYLGKKSEKYFNEIKRIANNINIFFDGRVSNDELENVIKNYHVMIHSAIFHEIYGIAIAESLSMGRPVLATRCGGAEMQVKDGYNGWLINPNDVDEMREKILHIINNKNEIIEFANNAQLPHPIEEYTNSLLNIYQEIKNYK